MSRYHPFYYSAIADSTRLLLWGQQWDPRWRFQVHESTDISHSVSLDAHRKRERALWHILSICQYTRNDKTGVDLWCTSFTPRLVFRSAVIYRDGCIPIIYFYYYKTAVESHYHSGQDFFETPVTLFRLVNSKELRLLAVHKSKPLHPQTACIYFTVPQPCICERNYRHLVWCSQMYLRYFRHVEMTEIERLHCPRYAL